MKFSEAIRKGCEMVPVQGRSLFFTDLHGRITRACAMGAAYLAYWGPNSPEIEAVLNCFDYVSLRIPEWEGHIGNRVRTMNDQDNKTREEIADWLEAQGL